MPELERPLNKIDKQIINICNDKGYFNLEEYEKDFLNKYTPLNEFKKLINCSKIKISDTDGLVKTDLDALPLWLKNKVLARINKAIEQGYINETDKGYTYTELFAQHTKTKAEINTAREMRFKRSTIDRMLKQNLIVQQIVDNKVQYIISPVCKRMLQKDNIKKPVKKEITPELKITQPVSEDNRKDQFKITAYDIKNIYDNAKDGFISNDKIASLSPGVLKRVETLVVAELLIKTNLGYELTKEFIERIDVRRQINLEHEKSHQRCNSLIQLTAEQKVTLNDLAVFLNLSQSQIQKYIYNGNDKLCQSNIKYFLRKGIIKRGSNKFYNVFVLTKEGEKLAKELTGDDKIFKSKLFSRREELKHDVLIYNAYQDVKKELEEKGMRIVSVLNDRAMRSRDAKAEGQMTGEYADLYIEYENVKTLERDFVNIEIDCGYSELTIQKKVSNIKNLKYFCNSSKQYSKVQAVLNGISRLSAKSSKPRTLSKARRDKDIEVRILDDDEIFV